MRRKKRERGGRERGEKEREGEREGGREGIKEEGEEEGIERHGSDNLLWMNQFNLKYKILRYGEELRWVTISL